MTTRDVSSRAAAGTKTRANGSLDVVAVGVLLALAVVLGAVLVKDGTMYSCRMRPLETLVMTSPLGSVTVIQTVP